MHEILWDTDVGATCGRPTPDYEQRGFIPILSNYGLIIEKEINNIYEHYDSVVYVDKYVIMPNHIHMIVVINNGCVNGRPQVAPTLSRVIKQFKGSITKKIGFSLWQKSFYDRIIRNEKEYKTISNYIYENPFRWQKDCYNPINDDESEVQS
jgi:REP element-mobilizing transposase RayT